MSNCERYSRRVSNIESNKKLILIVVAVNYHLPSRRGKFFNSPFDSLFCRNGASPLGAKRVPDFNPASSRC